MSAAEVLSSCDTDSLSLARVLWFQCVIAICVTSPGASAAANAP